MALLHHTHRQIERPHPEAHLVLVHDRGDDPVEETRVEAAGWNRDHKIYSILEHGFFVGAVLGLLIGALVIGGVATAFTETFHPWIWLAGGLSGVVFGAYFGGFIWLLTRCKDLFND